MGYHIIISNNTNRIDSHYIENIEELAIVDNLTQNTIIYEGEKHWTPVAIGADDKYSNYLKDWFCAGIRAQNLFKELAQNNQLIVEDISQDQESFKQYTDSAPTSIKRGDFLIRNARNIEIEVKCRTLYTACDATKSCYYKISFSETKKLDAMQKITGIPIIVAFFTRSGRQPLAETLKMISISKIMKEAKLKKVWYEEKNKDYCVPLSLMEDGFTLIDRARESISRSNEQGGSWNAILNESQEYSARQILIQAQKNLCNSDQIPFFMPLDGICFRCDGDIVGAMGITIATEHVTGCPLCARTFCD